MHFEEVKRSDDVLAHSPVEGAGAGIARQLLALEVKIHVVGLGPIGLELGMGAVEGYEADLSVLEVGFAPDLHKRGGFSGCIEIGSHFIS